MGMDTEKVTASIVTRECALCGFLTEERIVVCPNDGSALFTHKPDPLIGSVLADRFEIIELIGTGGMGNVYRARQRAVDRNVAVKVLHSERLRSSSSVLRFQQEAKAVAALSHTNIVGCLDYGLTEDNVPYIVMDYVEGISLDQEIKSSSLALERCINVFIQACDALDHAHKHGVIHRDIKPSNLMLVKADDGTEQVIILDFGIAKLQSSASESERPNLTVTGEVFGSPQYMSPEQCSGKQMDARSDIYSLGCVMYEALVGCPALSGETLIDIIFKQTSEQPASFKTVRPDLEIPAQLETLILRALEKDPAMRFQSMAVLKKNLEFVHRFAEEEKNQPPEAPPKEPSAMHRLLAHRRGLAIAGIVLVLILGFAGVGYMAFTNTETKTKAQIAWIELNEGAQSERLLPPIRSIRNTLSNEGRYLDALGYARTAVSLSKEIQPNSVLEATDLLALGSIMYHLKDDGAQEYLLKSRSQLRRLAQVDRNSKNWIDNVTGATAPDAMIAEIDSYLGQTNDQEGVSDLLNQAQDTMKSLGIEKAEPQFEKLITLKSKLSKPQLMVLCSALKAIADENTIRGNSERAESNYKQATEIATELHGPNSKTLAEIQRGLGMLYKRSSRFTSAEDTLLEALACANASLGESNELSLGILGDLAKLYSEMKEYKKSKDILALAKKLSAAKSP